MLKKYKRKNYHKLNPEKFHARYLVSKAIKNKELIKPDKCEKCGRNNRRIIAHHEDYSKPLTVMWICEQCHYWIHHKKTNL